MIAGVSYAEKLLADDERVVLDLRQHWKTLVLPVVAFLVACAAAGILIGLIDNGTATLVVLAVAAVAIVVFTVVPVLRWYFTHFVVSDRRVMMRSGILARNGRDVPLSRINDIHFEHSLLERILKCGSLVIESAGERGQVTLRDVPHVQTVQRKIYDLVEDTDERLSGRQDDEREQRFPRDR